VDPAGAARPAFDHAALAAALAAATGAPVAVDALPFASIHQTEHTAGEAEAAVTFTTAGDESGGGEAGRVTWAWDGAQLTKVLEGAAPGPPGLPAAEVASPDGRLAAYVEGHNLWVRELKSGRAFALTTDGAARAISNSRFEQRSLNLLGKLVESKWSSRTAT
jgi:hypothetical protein